MRLAPILALAVLAADGAAACTVSQSSITAYPGSVVTDRRTDGLVRSAWFDDPVERYDHGILGRDNEPETLWVDAAGTHGLCGTALTLDAAHVFEDTAPRLHDLDGDGTNEVIVVRTHLQRGAQLAVYAFAEGELRLVAATPYIGRSHRWLAPAGIADLDGDGRVEIAYVDRPHLVRTLRIWRWQDSGLAEVAAISGVTNHRIGEQAIAGGLRDCGDGPELIVASGDWTRLLALRFDGLTVSADDLGAWSEAAAATALGCR